jgi:FeS assembly SUF system regulator
MSSPAGVPLFSSQSFNCPQSTKPRRCCLIRRFNLDNRPFQAAISALAPRLSGCYYEYRTGLVLYVSEGDYVMVRLGKLTDYGLVLMTCIARDQEAPLRTARDLARESKLPLSTVSKLLKELLQSGLLLSHRGIKGGYILAREPHEISVVEMIAAIEGPMALTECSSEVTGLCNLEPCCPIKSNQQIINQAVRGVLQKITLSDLMHPMHLTNIKDARGRVVTTIASGGIQ